MTYGGGTWVAVARGHEVPSSALDTDYRRTTTTERNVNYRVMTSTDGAVTWTIHKSTLTHHKVRAKGSRLSDGDGVSVATEADDMSHWKSVTYGNGVFVALAEAWGMSYAKGDQPVGALLMTSPDGVTWTEQEPINKRGSLVYRCALGSQHTYEYGTARVLQHSTMSYA